MRVLSGRIERVTYFNKDNAYAVLNIRISKSILSTPATGVFPELIDIGSEKAVGLRVRLHGDWVRHKKYGRQFQFRRAELLEGGLLFFLTHIVKGIGERLARELIKKYGEENLEKIIDETPEKLMEIKGIKEKKLQKIISSWNKYKQIKELTKFFASRGADNVTASLIIRIYKHFDAKGVDPIRAINENPYTLTEVRGIGFKTCDKIAMSLGIDEQSPYRFKALADYILLSEASDNGHTVMYYNNFMEKATEYLEMEDTPQLREKFLREVFLMDPYRYFYDEILELVGLNIYRKKESYIYNKIIEKIDKKSPYVSDEETALRFIKIQENKLGFKLSEKQFKAVYDLFTKGHSVFILCGYAGTGKSTISKIILEYYTQFVKKNEIVCCAFTGMASKRIKDLTGFTSRTIHSLLGYTAEGFEHNERNPLPHKVVLLDEASMVNVDIFYALLKALRDDTVFIMVGDDAQLPPIGAGNVFADLLGEERIPKAKLTQIYRQSNDSVITYFANFIRKGEIPQGYKKSYKDWKFKAMDIPGYFKLRKEKSEKELKEIRDEHYTEMLRTMLSEIDETAEKLDGIRKIWDIQVIAPMRDSILGTRNLNTLLQERLNRFAQPIEIKAMKLKKYDKVIHLKNQDMMVFDADTLEYMLKNGLEPDMELAKGKRRIYNGALGLVAAIDKENEIFYVHYPDERELFVAYDFDDYGDIINLGYALTVHKTQGSQFKYVFMPIINSFYIMLNSKLLYTAITRSVEKIHIYAQDFAFKHACKNKNDTNRLTHISLFRDGLEESNV